VPDPLRVLHCPALVGGNPQQLARSERHLGLASHAVAFSQNYIQYECDEILWSNEDSAVLREIKRWKLLRRALKAFDVIHFNSGLSILPSRIAATPGPTSQLRGLMRMAYWMYGRLFYLRDLPLLKRAGKAIFVTYQGDDARQGDYCRKHFKIHFADEVPPGYYSAAGDARKREDIAIFDRYADGIFALNPDLLRVLPARAQFLPYANVDLSKWSPDGHRPGSRARPFLVHAPSHQGVKGTRFILDAVNRLRSEGLEFDFMLVENLSRDEARRIYERADLMVDQLLSGWYGGAAVELMALGKPVVCYLREDDLGYIDDRMRAELPLIRATPDTICEVLRGCLGRNREMLPQMGERSRRFVEKWHDPGAIAALLKDQYRSSVERLRRTRA
jgi:glycosyltransferase involved in cell wall biosynthesis